MLTLSYVYILMNLLHVALGEEEKLFCRVKKVHITSRRVPFVLRLQVSGRNEPDSKLRRRINFICFDNEGGSPSVSDVHRSVIIIKLLGFPFSSNFRHSYGGEKFGNTRFLLPKVAHTKYCDVLWVLE
jgi:hypothetical protein